MKDNLSHVEALSLLTKTTKPNSELGIPWSHFEEVSPKETTPRMGTLFGVPLHLKQRLTLPGNPPFDEKRLKKGKEKTPWETNISKG